MCCATLFTLIVSHQPTFQARQTIEQQSPDAGPLHDLWDDSDRTERVTACMDLVWIRATRARECHNAPLECHPRPSRQVRTWGAGKRDGMARTPARLEERHAAALHHHVRWQQSDAPLRRRDAGCQHVVQQPARFVPELCTRLATSRPSDRRSTRRSTSACSPTVRRSTSSIRANLKVAPVSEVW